MPNKKMTRHREREKETNEATTHNNAIINGKQATENGNENGNPIRTYRQRRNGWLGGCGRTVGVGAGAGQMMEDALN